MMVLVFSGRDTLPDAKKLERALRHAIPDLPSQAFSQDGNTQALVVPYRDSLITIMNIEAPAPLAESDPQIRNAWYWPAAWSELKTHRSHMVVSVGGGLDGQTRARLLACVLVPLLGVMTNPIGLCNVGSGTLLSHAMAMSLIGQADTVALPLFISCHFAREAEGAFPKPAICASTKGLSDFGLMEVEVRGYRGQVPDLYQFILGFAAYLIEQRPTIADGHTLGRGGDERITVKVQKSMYYDAQVYCLYF